MSISVWNTSEINLSYFDPKDLKYLNKVSLKEKLIKTFFRAFFFKSLFRFARSLDRSVNIHKILNLQSILDIFLNRKNFSYSFYFLMISTLFKIYRFIVTTYFDKNWFEDTYETQEKLNYKMK